MTSVQRQRRESMPPPTLVRRRWVGPALIVAAFLLVGGALGGAGAGLSTVQRNDSTVYLPRDAEATRVAGMAARFTGLEMTPAIVVYHKASGITQQDRTRLVLVVLAIADVFDSDLGGPPIGPVVSEDGTAARIIVQFAGSDPAKIRPGVEWLRTNTSRPGLAAHVAGPAAVQADLVEVFSAVNGMLLLVTGAIVLLILIAVYRSPILPLIVLAAAGVSLGLANGTVYLLAKAGALTVSGDAQGVLDVLVLGAGTDYALLFTSRYREELRRYPDRYQAARAAWRAAAPPILASGATVAAGLLCLLASGLAAMRGLGPVAAIGIGCALASMLLLLPALLVLCGRVAFWPARPVVAEVSVTKGVWWRIARSVGRRPRLVWAVTALALAGLATAAVRLEAHGVPRGESFLAPVDSNAGQDLLTRHFPEAAGVPAIIIADAARVDEVVAAARGVPGVTKADSYVDFLLAYDRKRAGLPPPGPKAVDGRVRVDATLAAAPDSVAAREVVAELRRVVAAVPGARAEVGGYTAANLDVQDTARRDRLIVVPLVLLVVFGILVLLLRALLAPLLLIATVVLSYLATLGACALVFRDVFGFAGADASFPLYAFVFLVALGVDYNIFLMTRVREEVARSGHREGTLVGLAVTGGVITSAGVVLAATFAALAVLPLVFLAELAFAVAFGVLLDTVVVRTLLVPALTVDIGRFVWWPGRLWRRTVPSELSSPG